MLKGADFSQGETGVEDSGWLGWRVHANKGQHMRPVTIVVGHLP